MTDIARNTNLSEYLNTRERLEARFMGRPLTPRLIQEMRREDNRLRGRDLGPEAVKVSYVLTQFISHWERINKTREDAISALAVGYPCGDNVYHDASAYTHDVIEKGRLASTFTFPDDWQSPDWDFVVPAWTRYVPEPLKAQWGRLSDDVKQSVAATALIATEKEPS